MKKPSKERKRYSCYMMANYNESPTSNSLLCMQPWIQRIYAKITQKGKIHEQNK